MGGGDLNMKKSWHPLLLKNQERVWLEEKKALEEKKKLEQLRKELEEERQLQELQRLQEEQTGKKRSEKLEWMYSTPATGSGATTNDLEDYLLGKKRVDKILIGDENAKIGASHKSFIAVQNANTPRDIAAKVREDPLFAIKQQEQAAYQALVSNPLRLKELQERNGVMPSKKDKKKDKQARREEKAEKKRLKALDKARDRPTIRDYERSRPRSTSPYRRPYYRSPSPSYSSSNGHSRSRSRSPRRLSEDIRSGRTKNRHISSPRRSDSSDYRHSKRKRSISKERSRSRSFEGRPQKYSRRDPSPESFRYARRTSRERYSQPSIPSRDSALSVTVNDRAARLAAMTSSASELTAERRQRLEALLAQEKDEKDREDRERMQRAKTGGVGGFLEGERKKVYAGGMEGGLAERIRRGRGTLVSVD